MGKTVLVIDDDPMVFEILNGRLKAFDCQMIAAKDGAEGLEKAKTIKPNLIFLDYFMPGENGLAILQQLKAETADGIDKIPVVMLTGKEGLEIECLVAGAAGYVTKPFDLFKLKEILSKFVSA